MFLEKIQTKYNRDGGKWMQIANILFDTGLQQTV